MTNNQQEDSGEDSLFGSQAAVGVRVGGMKVDQFESWVACQA